MKKRVWALCLLLALTGCGNKTVSEERYQEAVTERDEYKSQYVVMLDEVEVLEEQIDDLDAECKALEAQVSATQVELEEAKEAAELAVAEAEAARVDETDEEVPDGTTFEVTEDVAVICKLPEGFEEIEAGIYCTADYPNDTSNIYISELTVENSIWDYTEEQFADAMIRSNENQGYTLQDFEVIQFARGENGGVESLLIDISYTFSGMNIKQMQYLLCAGDIVWTITYTTTDEFGWQEEFYESIDSISVR